MRFRTSFHPYAMFTVLCWSISFPITRLALVHFSPYSLGFLRYLIASLVLLLFVKNMKAPAKRDIGWFILSGGLGFFLYMITFNTGAKSIPSATCSVIVATCPMITALMARFAYKEVLKPYQWAAIGLSFLGVVVLTVLEGGFTSGFGLVWLFVSAICTGGYNVIQRRLTKQYSALETTTYSVFAGAILLGIFAPAGFREIQTANTSQWMCLLFLGLFASAAGYLSWSKAFSMAEKTSSVSNYMFVTPFLAGIFGFLIAGDRVTGATLLGGILIFAGLLFFNFGNKVGATASQKRNAH